MGLTLFFERPAELGGESRWPENPNITPPQKSQEHPRNQSPHEPGLSEPSTWGNAAIWMLIFSYPFFYRLTHGPMPNIKEASFYIGWSFILPTVLNGGLDWLIKKDLHQSESNQIP